MLERMINYRVVVFPHHLFSFFFFILPKPKTSEVTKSPLHVEKNLILFQRGIFESFVNLVFWVFLCFFALCQIEINAIFINFITFAWHTGITGL